MATTDPNRTRIPKQRWYTLNVEYSKNDQTINQKLSLKASSLDDLKKKIATEIDFPNNSKIRIDYKKGNKLVSMNDLLDLVSNVTWNVRLSASN